MGMFLSLLALPAAPLFLIPGWIAVLLYPLLPGVAQVLALLPRGVLAGMIFRDHRMIIPHGDDCFQPHDNAYFIGIDGLFFVKML